MTAKLDPTTFATDGNAGIMFADYGRNQAFTFGLRRDPSGAAIQVVSEAVYANVRQGVAIQDTLGSTVSPVWFRMRCSSSGLFSSPADIRIVCEWSTIGASGPFDFVEVYVSGLRQFDWAGFYTRTTGSSAAAINCKFSNVAIRSPHGDRPFYWYVVRDPADPGDPDMRAADLVGQGLKQHHTVGHVVTSPVTLYDDESTPYDLGPMGGI